jgi:hypothetical protein
MHSLRPSDRISSSAAHGRYVLGLSLATAALGACATEDPPSVDIATSTLVGACVLGDGYEIPSGGHLIVYPVGCPSDCDDFPNGGLDFGLFCLNGGLGENDPLLTGGSVAPVLVPQAWNGHSRCTTRPNPYTTPPWGQSSDRKHCVRL